MTVSTSILRQGQPGMRRPPRMGSIAFFVLFPGFFVYHVLVGTGRIPAVLDGYSTRAAALVLPFLALAFVNHGLRHRRSRTQVDGIFFLFLAYFGAVVGFNLAWRADLTIAVPHLGILIQFAAIYLAIRLVDPTSPLFRWAALLSFFVLTATVFTFSAGGAFTVVAGALEGTEEKLADYQGYAFVYVVLVLFLAATLRSANARLAVYALAVPALFLIGARAEFAAFLLVPPIFEFCLGRRKALFWIAGAGILSTVLLLLVAGADLFPGSRVLALMASTPDESVMERARLTREAWRSLGDSPLLGAYASYPPGEYAHNLLSVWVDLGVVGFLFFVLLLLLPAIDLVLGLRTRAAEPDHVLALAVFAVSAVLFVLAKNFTYQMFPIALALYARYAARRRERRSEAA